MQTFDPLDPKIIKRKKEIADVHNLFFEMIELNYGKDLNAPKLDLIKMSLLLLIINIEASISGDSKLHCIDEIIKDLQIIKSYESLYKNQSVI